MTYEILDDCIPQQVSSVVVVQEPERIFDTDRGQTSLIERFNCTLRQRVSRLVRKTLSNSCEVRESCWCSVVLCPLLQCILTCLGLPKINVFTYY